MSKIQARRRPAPKKITYEDPFRHFIAAYMSQAARDYISPRKDLPIKDLESAAILINSEDGRAILNHLGITYRKMTISLENTPGGAA